MGWNTLVSAALSNEVASDVAVVRARSTLRVGSACLAMDPSHVLLCGTINRAPCSMPGFSLELTALLVPVLMRYCFRIFEFRTPYSERRNLEFPALRAAAAANKEDV